MKPITRREAERSGLIPKRKKKTAGKSDAPTRPGDAEYHPPDSNSRTLAEPVPCGECGHTTPFQVREGGPFTDDLVWRCVPCFTARRKLLRKWGPTPRSLNCR